MLLQVTCDRSHGRICTPVHAPPADRLPRFTRRQHQLQCNAGCSGSVRRPSTKSPNWPRMPIPTELTDAFLALAERARGQGRAIAGAYYDRAAEFFLSATDPRRPAARQRFLSAMRTGYGVTPDLIPFGAGCLPAYDLRPERQVGPADGHVRRIRQLRRRIPADARRHGRRGTSHRGVRGPGSGQRTRGLRPHNDSRMGATGGGHSRSLSASTTLPQWGFRWAGVW